MAATSTLGALEGTGRGSGGRRHHVAAVGGRVAVGGGAFAYGNEEFYDDCARIAVDKPQRRDRCAGRDQCVVKEVVQPPGVRAVRLGVALAEDAENFLHLQRQRHLEVRLANRRGRKIECTIIKPIKK